MNKRIYVIVALCLFPACRPVKEMQRDNREKVKIVRETFRDTLIVTERDSSWLSVLLECDSTGKVLMKELLAYQAGQQLALPEMKLSENILTTKSLLEASALRLSLRDRYECDTVVREREVVKQVEVNRLNGVQRLLMGMGVIWLILLLVRLKKRFML